jgi:hypothetical protein
MMIITPQQMQKIVAAGGGLTLDAASMTFQQLKDILGSANGSKAGITLKNLSGLTAAQLQELAGLAPALVVFDLTTG